jgi:hypothetical protein
MSRIVYRAERQALERTFASLYGGRPCHPHYGMVTPLIPTVDFALVEPLQLGRRLVC